MGARWHWKDTRKVLRNLQIISEYKQRASEVIQMKQETSLSARYVVCEPASILGESVVMCVQVPSPFLLAVLRPSYS